MAECTLYSTSSVSHARSQLRHKVGNAPVIHTTLVGCASHPFQGIVPFKQVRRGWASPYVWHRILR